MVVVVVVGRPVLLQPPPASLLQGSNSSCALKKKTKQAAERLLFILFAASSALIGLNVATSRQQPGYGVNTHPRPLFPTPQNQITTWFEVQGLGGVVLTVLLGIGVGGGAVGG